MPPLAPFSPAVSLRLLPASINIEANGLGIGFPLTTPRTTGKTRFPRALESFNAYSAFVPRTTYELRYRRRGEKKLKPEKLEKRVRGRDDIEAVVVSLHQW